jgi:hypothetical protein
MSFAGSYQKITVPLTRPRYLLQGLRPALLSGFGGRFFELSRFGRRAHRGRRSGTAGDRAGHRVELARANLALMPRRRVAVRFGREFLLLELGIGGHAAIAVALGEIEHALGCGRLPRMTPICAKE